jgi:dolichol-phosphate mannosyltransferase
MARDTLVIVPTYNEHENIRPLAARVLSLPTTVDLLIVDDNSPDGTGPIADELAAQHNAVHVMHRATKDGLGRAYCAGFAWALERQYEFVFEMDGDFSHDPADIPKFLTAAQNVDLVLGSRYSEGIRVINWPLQRLMLSLSAAKYVRLVTGMPFSDPTGGYKCFRRCASPHARPERGPLEWVQFPDRDHPQALATGHAGGGGADHLYRSVPRSVQDVAQDRL